MAVVEESYVVLTGMNAFVDYNLDDANAASFRIWNLGASGSLMSFYYSNDGINWVLGQTTAIFSGGYQTGGGVGGGSLRVLGNISRTTTRYFRLLITNYTSDLAVEYVSTRTGV